jgi:hypothetical protein
LVSPYRVQSPVSLSTFPEFISALKGNAIKITEAHLTKCQCLCEEFGFSELSAKLSGFCSSTEFEGAEDADAGGRIAALTEKANQHDYEISTVEDKVTQLSTNFEGFVVKVSTLRSASTGIQALPEGVSTLKTQITVKRFTVVPSHSQLHLPSPSVCAVPPVPSASQQHSFSLGLFLHKSLLFVAVSSSAFSTANLVTSHHFRLHYNNNHNHYHSNQNSKNMTHKLHPQPELLTKTDNNR